jgi:hypothetical protein
MADRRRPLRLLSAAFLAALLSLSIVACGSSSEEKTDLMEGEPVTLGDLQYNVVFSRFLNPHDVEDHEYLVGQPPPPADAAYFGVFVQIINKSHDRPESIPAEFKVVDTEEQEFTSLASESVYALPLGGSIGPEDAAPALDSSPQVGPIGASLVLFEIPDAAAEDRPLQFVISGTDGPASIDLDI